MVMADYYENLAADYDWLFDDDALASGLAINHPATARLPEGREGRDLAGDHGLRGRLHGGDGSGALPRSGRPLRRNRE